MSGKKGFTLIELIVVIAVIGILAAAAVVNFGKNEDRDVRAEKDRLTAYLREMQNKALAGDVADIDIPTDRKLCGYGIHWQDEATIKTYYMFSGNLNADCKTTNNRYANRSGNLADYFPRNGVAVGDFVNDIFFFIPDGEVRRANATGGTTNGFPVSINLTKNGLTNPIPVYIEQSGRIY